MQKKQIFELSNLLKQFICLSNLLKQIVLGFKVILARDHTCVTAGVEQYTYTMVNVLILEICR